jgi:hypothetical protein
MRIQGRYAQYLPFTTYILIHFFIDFNFCIFTHKYIHFLYIGILTSYQIDLYEYSFVGDSNYLVHQPALKELIQIPFLHNTLESLFIFKEFIINFPILDLFNNPVGYCRLTSIGL